MIQFVLFIIILPYRFREILNLDGHLVTRISASYLKISKGLATDGVILSPKFGRD